jgi:cytochrome c oxidase subunit IV
MGQLGYEASKKIATKTITILAVITVFEVLFALLGKGYLIEGFHISGWITGFVMITLSLVKAYLIVYEFMHMKYEVPGLVKTVLLPTLLLVWAIIAFMMEGNYWNNSRARVKNDTVKTEAAPDPQGSLIDLGTTKKM